MPAQPFLALITPIAGDLGTWGGGNVPYPTPPIHYPQPPLGTWGGAGQPFPTTPIYIPGGWPPLGTWGGVGQPYPDQGLPGGQPGGPTYPSQGPGFPTHPIVLPPDLPPEMPDPDNRPIEWKTAWTPQTGWVVVGIPQGPAPTPSAG